MHDNSSLTITNCELSNFKEHGIRMETKKYVIGPEGKIGGVDLLQNVSEVYMSDCKFENNGKGDILLQAQPTAALLAKQEPGGTAMVS